MQLISTSSCCMACTNIAGKLWNTRVTILSDWLALSTYVSYSTLAGKFCIALQNCRYYFANVPVPEYRGKDTVVLST